MNCSHRKPDLHEGDSQCRIGQPMFRRLWQLFQMWSRANKLGFPLRRTKGWHPPERILLNGKWVPIACPQDSGCVNAFRDIFLHDCYGLETVRHPVNTVLDIGANAGFFSLSTRNVFPRATIHAYEPNARLLETLIFNSTSGNFSFFREGVGLSEGRAFLDQDQTSTVFAQTHIAPDGDVPIVSFSKCLERLGGTVDFLKCACEGVEWQLFQDSSSWKHVKFVGMEYHCVNGHTGDECRSILANLGFHLLVPTLHGTQYQLIWAYR